MRSKTLHQLLIVLCVASGMRGAEQKPNTLVEFSGALERLAATVAPAVVQVQVTAWCASASGGTENTAILGSCKVVGSGVIVDPSGYIITNEHVVRNARSIRVLLTPKPHQSADESASSGAPHSVDTVLLAANNDPLGKREVLDAIVVGANCETDLALLKINASGLPAISLQQTNRGPRQGQIALAIGSPEGLDNTMTIGIISAVGRQPVPDYPMLYIQTDAAINPGSSGGPLLDVRGDLIGINTFIFNENGRNQGLGFAVPAAVVRYVYEQLRTSGVVRQSLVGVRVQTVTPGLALGLGLSRGYGVMISDVLPGSPADVAGLRPRDIISAVDGASISTLPYYTAMMYLHDGDVPMALTVLRGGQTLQFQVASITVDDKLMDRSIDPLECLIPEFGVFGKAVDPLLARLKNLRSEVGVYVFATTTADRSSGPALAPGDVIASFNAEPVSGIQDLREAIHGIASGKPAVLQIERSGQYVYVEWELQAPPPQLSTDRSAKAIPNAMGKRQ